MPIRLAQVHLIPRNSYMPKTPRITYLTTGWACEPFGPPDTLQMAGAGRLIREKMLKLQQNPRVMRHAQEHTPKH